MTLIKTSFLIYLKENCPDTYKSLTPEQRMIIFIALEEYLKQSKMKLKNQYGDVIEVTDKIKVTLNTRELKYNYSFWTKLSLAKRWVYDFRGVKSDWKANED